MIESVINKSLANAIKSNSQSTATPSAKAPSQDVTDLQDIATSGKDVPVNQSTSDVQSKQIDREELDRAVKQMNDYVQEIHRDVLFSVDEDTGRSVVSVIDAKTEEVIRQFPSEELLSISKNIKEAQGLLINAKA